MKFHSTLAFASLFVLTVFATSCANNRTNEVKTDDSMVAIEIRNSNEMDIRQAVVETFLVNGYRRENAYGLTFEKKGDLARQIEYASYMGGAAKTRVDVRIEPISATSFLVKVNAFTITHQSTTFGDTERPVGGFRKGNYKDLLQEVQERLTIY